MFVTKNRAGVITVLLLAAALFITACAPPGPRALLKGRKLLEAGLTDAALVELKTATTLLPTNAAAWNYLGLAYHRSGQWTNAAEAYSRALKLDRDLLEVRFNLGCLWLDQDKLDAAKTEFTAYTLRRGNAVEGWLKLGAAQLRGRETSGAEKCFREALRVETNNVEALNGLGLVQLQRNRPREAAESFADALKFQSDYRPALLNLATVSGQNLNNRPEALRRYRQYLALQPKAADWDAVNAIVRSLEEPAVTPLQARPQANTVTSNHVVAIVPPATNQTKVVPVASPRPAPTNPKPESTNAIAKPAPVPVITTPTATSVPPPEVVKLAPEPTIRTTLDESRPPTVISNAPTRTATAVSNNVPAVKSERRGFLSKLNPFKSDSKPPVGNSGKSNAAPVSASPEARSTSLASGRYAYVSPTAPLAGNRREAELAFAQGQQSQRANRPAEALQSFRRATQLDPAYFEAYYNLGLAAFGLRSFPVALLAWENALALRPENADVRYNFALTLKAADYPQDAADELEKLLALHPDEARGHLTLGNLYAEQLRDVPRARRHYNKVLQLDPRNPQAPAIRYWLVANPG
ncbi:MAG: tetratricopeptide repeat protein [Verrucomicrobiota bacterium]